MLNAPVPTRSPITPTEAQDAVIAQLEKIVADLPSMGVLLDAGPLNEPVREVCDNDNLHTARVAYRDNYLCVACFAKVAHWAEPGDVLSVDVLLVDEAVAQAVA